MASVRMPATTGHRDIQCSISSSGLGQHDWQKLSVARKITWPHTFLPYFGAQASSLVGSVLVTPSSQRLL